VNEADYSIAAGLWAQPCITHRVISLYRAPGHFPEFSDKEYAMNRILFGLGAVTLSVLTAGCGAYYERTNYAYAPPGATYYGDRYYDGYASRTYPSTAYVYPSTAYTYPSTTGYYYSRGDYYRNYRGVHSPDERTM